MAASVAVTLGVQARAATMPPDPADKGLWEVLDHRLPFPGAHAVLLPTGKVLFLPGGPKQNGARHAGSAYLWDPDHGNCKTWDLPVDFSLGSQRMLPDGRVLLTGGSKEASAIRIKQSYLFDPSAEEWLRVNDLPERGPCPTLVELGDGRVLAVGGAGRNPVHVYEKSNGWSTVPSPALNWPLYPQLTLLGGGSALYSGQHFGGGAGLSRGLLNPDGYFTELPEVAGSSDVALGLREQGATVLLPPAQDQQVMVFGGGAPPRSEAQILDLSQFGPSVRPALPLKRGRANFNAVLLPDRTILICGGSSSHEGGQTAATDGEIYDPSTGVWTTTAPAQVPRMAHSSALLLDDGRVITAGSTNVLGYSELRIEVFSPPYLFRGKRPTIAEISPEIVPGMPFRVRTTDSDIRWLNLVRPAAVSHGFDSGQRVVDVPFESRAGGLLEALVPNSPNIAPPGWYMLFLVNHKGIPSPGKWVRLTYPPRSRPSGLGEVTLNGTAPSRGKHSFPEPDITGDPVERPAENHKFRTAVTLDRPEQDDNLPRFSRDDEKEDASPITSFVESPVAETARDDETRNRLTLVQDEADPLTSQDLGSTTRTVASALQDPPLASLVEHRYSWGRPALVIASSGLLALAMVQELPFLQAAAAFLFLLFAPGMALVGLFRPSGWASELALAIGLSIGLETFLTIGMLYLGNWSAEASLVVLLSVSLAGATAQLFRAAFGSPGGLSVRRLRQVRA